VHFSLLFYSFDLIEDFFLSTVQHIFEVIVFISLCL
jgi:hypothetical protein